MVKCPFGLETMNVEMYSSSVVHWWSGVSEKTCLIYSTIINNVYVTVETKWYRKYI